MVKARFFLLVTAASAWAPPSPIVLEPREETPCLQSCEGNPSSDSCKLCCQSVTHEVDWKCQVAAPHDKAACCEDWNAQCWNAASDANLGHACNQCRPPTAAPTDAPVAAPTDAPVAGGGGNDDDDDHSGSASDDSDAGLRPGPSSTRYGFGNMGCFNGLCV